MSSSRSINNDGDYDYDGGNYYQSATGGYGITSDRQDKMREIEAKYQPSLTVIHSCTSVVSSQYQHMSPNMQMDCSINEGSGGNIGVEYDNQSSNNKISDSNNSAEQKDKQNNHKDSEEDIEDDEELYDPYTQNEQNADECSVFNNSQLKQINDANELDKLLNNSSLDEKDSSDAERENSHNSTNDKFDGFTEDPNKKSSEKHKSSNSVQKMQQINKGIEVEEQEKKIEQLKQELFEASLQKRTDNAKNKHQKPSQQHENRKNIPHIITQKDESNNHGSSTKSLQKSIEKQNKSDKGGGNTVQIVEKSNSNSQSGFSSASNSQNNTTYNKIMSKYQRFQEQKQKLDQDRQVQQNQQNPFKIQLKQNSLRIQIAVNEQCTKSKNNKLVVKSKEEKRQEAQGDDVQQQIEEAMQEKQSPQKPSPNYNQVVELMEDKVQKQKSVVTPVFQVQRQNHREQMAINLQQSFKNEGSFSTNLFQKSSSPNKKQTYLNITNTKHSKNEDISNSAESNKAQSPPHNSHYSVSKSNSSPQYDQDIAESQNIMDSIQQQLERILTPQSKNESNHQNINSSNQNNSSLQNSQNMANKKSEQVSQNIENQSVRNSCPSNHSQLIMMKSQNNQEIELQQEGGALNNIMEMDDIPLLSSSSFVPTQILKNEQNPNKACQNQGKNQEQEQQLAIASYFTDSKLDQSFQRLKHDFNKTSASRIAPKLQKMDEKTLKKMYDPYKPQKRRKVDQNDLKTQGKFQNQGQGQQLQFEDEQVHDQSQVQESNKFNDQNQHCSQSQQINARNHHQQQQQYVDNDLQNELNLQTQQQQFLIGSSFPDSLEDGQSRLNSQQAHVAYFGQPANIPNNPIQNKLSKNEDQHNSNNLLNYNQQIASNQKQQQSSLDKITPNKVLQQSNVTRLPQQQQNSENSKFNHQAQQMQSPFGQEMALNYGFQNQPSNNHQQMLYNNNQSPMLFYSNSPSRNQFQNQTYFPVINNPFGLTSQLNKSIYQQNQQNQQPQQFMNSTLPQQQQQQPQNPNNFINLNNLLLMNQNHQQNHSQNQISPLTGLSNQNNNLQDNQLIIGQGDMMISQIGMNTNSTDEKNQHNNFLIQSQIQQQIHQDLLEDENNEQNNNDDMNDLDNQQSRGNNRLLRDMHTLDSDDINALQDEQDNQQQQ
eukprot:403371526